MAAAYQLDVTASAVLLPAAADDLGSSTVGVQWAANAFTVALAATIVVGGAVADRWGRRAATRAAGLAFVGGSVLAALAPSIELLAVARGLQGVAAGVLFPAAVGLLADAYAGPRAPAAFARWSLAVAAGTVLGPLAAGGATALLSWRAGFLASVPLLLAGLVAAGRCAPDAARGGRVDVRGAVLVAGVVGGASAALIGAGSAGVTGAPAIVGAAVALLAGAGLAHTLAAGRSPLAAAVRLLAPPAQRAAGVAGFALHASVVALLLVVSVHLQDELGLSAIETALWITIVAACSVVAAVPAGRVLARRGGRPVLVGGLLVVTAGCLALTLPGTDDDAWRLAPALILLGLGLGTVTGPVAELAVRGLDPGRRSVASGLNSSSRQLGASAGVAVLGSLAAQHGLAAAALLAAATAAVGAAVIARQPRSA